MSAFPYAHLAEWLQNSNRLAIISNPTVAQRFLFVNLSGGNIIRYNGISKDCTVVAAIAVVYTRFKGVLQQ